jgi:hypothetical protein
MRNRVLNIRGLLQTRLPPTNQRIYRSNNLTGNYSDWLVGLSSVDIPTHLIIPSSGLKINQ